MQNLTEEVTMDNQKSFLAGLPSVKGESKVTGNHTDDLDYKPWDTY